MVSIYCLAALRNRPQFDHILHDSAEDAHLHARPLEFSHYEPAPPQLQQKLQAAHRPQAEAE